MRTSLLETGARSSPIDRDFKLGEYWFPFHDSQTFWMAEHTGMSPQYLELSERCSTLSLTLSLAPAYVSLLGPLKRFLDH